MISHIVIDRRFRGPPDSGNGGYSCGVLAGFIDGPAEVTLLLPPPLEIPLRVVRDGAGAVLWLGRQEIARARPGRLATPCLPPPSLAQAEAAATRYAGFDGHLLPECFVCGPDRAAADGMRIFAGVDDSGHQVAAPWVPDGSLADADGAVRAEHVWAALDCPSYFGLMHPGLIALLGRMTANVLRPIVPGRPCVVSAWPIAVNGRKHVAGSAIFSAEGELLAHAEAVWVELQYQSAA